MLANYMVKNDKTLKELEPYQGAADDWLYNPEEYYRKTGKDPFTTPRKVSPTNGTPTDDHAKYVANSIEAQFEAYAPNATKFLKAIMSDTADIKTNTGNSASYASSLKSKVDSIKASFTTMASNAMIVSDPKTITALKGYADGGYPETGSVFLAGERGAELVSSSSTGTQVANRDQIAASMQAGMEAATAEQNAILREQNALLQAILEKDTSITTDSISNALGRSNIRAGRTVVVTGG